MASSSTLSRNVALPLESFNRRRSSKSKRVSFFLCYKRISGLFQGNWSGENQTNIIRRVALSDFEPIFEGKITFERGNLRYSRSIPVVMRATAEKFNQKLEIVEDEAVKYIVKETGIETADIDEEEDKLNQRIKILLENLDNMEGTSSEGEEDEAEKKNRTISEKRISYKPPGSGKGGKRFNELDENESWWGPQNAIEGRRRSRKKKEYLNMDFPSDPDLLLAKDPESSKLYSTSPPPTSTLSPNIPETSGNFSRSLVEADSKNGSYSGRSSNLGKRRTKKGRERPAGAETVGVPLNGNGETEYQRLKINLDLELFQARQLGQRWRMEEAEKILRQCISVWPEDGRAYVTLGKLLQRQGKPRDARQVYEEGCQALGGENAHLWQSWAVLEQRLGNTARARKLFDAATAADSCHAPGWHGWAVLELREGNLSKARELLRKGLRRCGANDYLYQTLGTMEVQAGRVEEARTLFFRATRANQSSAASWVSWAILEANEGEVETSRKLFQKALEASPKNRYAYQAWALLEMEIGNTRDARKLLEVGHNLNPRDSALVIAFALFEYQNGSPEKARELFQNGAAVNPKYGPLWRAWGWVEWKEGQLEKAREKYEKASLVDTSSPRTYQAWGILEEQAGNTGLARELFKQGLRADPANVPTWLSWAAMEERLGNSVRADELRSLCLQQRTEVVDSGWDLSDMLGPAFERVRSFFNFDVSRNSKSKAEDYVEEDLAEDWDSEDEMVERFDLDEFLDEKVKPKLGKQVANSPLWNTPREVGKGRSFERKERSRRNRRVVTGEDPRLDGLRNKQKNGENPTSS